MRGLVGCFSGDELPVEFPWISNGILKVESKMPQLARGIAQAAELVKRFNGLDHVGIPGVVKWRYTLDNDWSGDPAIFFWVTLTDEASKPANLRTTKNGFIGAIGNHVDLPGNWDLFPYYNFRSQSEQAKLKDEVYE